MGHSAVARRVLYLVHWRQRGTVIRPNVGNLSWTGMHLMTKSSGLEVWSLFDGRTFFVHLLLVPPREVVLGDQLGSLLAHHRWPALAYCPIAQLRQGAQGQAQPMKAN